MKVCLITHTAKVGGLPTWVESLKAGSLRNDKRIRYIKPKFRSILNDLKLIIHSDIIHQSHFSILSNLYLICAKVLNKKIVTTVHGDYISAAGDYSPIRKIVSKIMIDFAIKKANIITVPSEFLKKIILNRFPHTRIEIVPNPLFIGNFKDIKKTDLGLKESDILIVEITDFKYTNKAGGVVPIIKAVNKLPKKYKLLIIGGRGDYKSISKKYSNERIIFMGQMDRRKALGILSISDLAIHFSYLDNAPYFVLEAIALNVPVLTNKVGAIYEMTEGNVIYVTKDNLKNTITRTINDKAFREKAIEKQSKIILKHSPRKIYKRFELVYNLLHSEKDN